MWRMIARGLRERKQSVSSKGMKTSLVLRMMGLVRTIFHTRLDFLIKDMSFDVHLEPKVDLERGTLEQNSLKTEPFDAC